MPSGWDVYYLVFLSAALALLIPIGLAGISLLFSPGSGVRKRRLPSADQEAAIPVKLPEALGNRINIRFFLGVNSTLVLIALMLGLIPSATAIHANEESHELIRSLFAVISIGALASLGLLYSVAKGDLSWL